MAKVAVDKWKTKKTFEIVAPPLFKNKVIGETIASSSKAVQGRVLNVNLSEITGGDPRRQKMKLKFKIEEVDGEKAKAKFLGHFVIQDYSRSLVKRRTSKVYVNQKVITKDNKNLVIKAFVVTTKKINKSKKTDLGKKFREILNVEAKLTNFDDLINKILSNNLGMSSKKALQKIYPVKQAVIQKTEVL